MLRLVVAGLGVAALVAGRRFRDWGATKGECGTTFPGDEFVGDPADVTTRAVTVDAPAEVVWRWLVQIGQDRGGFYCYDLLEHLLGVRIESTREIHDEWQELHVGDVVRLVQPGWLGFRAGLALPVVRLEPGRSIVLRESPPQVPWDAVWSLHVVPHGPHRTRLISRSRTARRGRLTWLAGQATDPLTLLMTRRMLLGVKSRAEHPAWRTGTVTVAS